MKTLNKKVIRTTVHEALNQVLGTLALEQPSRKTAKLIEKTSKRISKELRDDLKRQMRKMEKAGKLSKKPEAEVFAA